MDATGKWAAHVMDSPVMVDGDRQQAKCLVAVTFEMGTEMVEVAGMPKAAIVLVVEVTAAGTAEAHGGVSKNGLVWVLEAISLRRIASKILLSLWRSSAARHQQWREIFH